MTEGLRGNKLPLSRGLESDYRLVLSASQKVDASITQQGFKGARALTMHGVWKGAMKCAFDFTSPTEPHSRNGFFVKFELPWANLPPSSGAGWGPGWPAHLPSPSCAVFPGSGSGSSSLSGWELQVRGADLVIPAGCAFPCLSWTQILCSLQGQVWPHCKRACLMVGPPLGARCHSWGRPTPIWSKEPMLWTGH